MTRFVRYELRTTDIDAARAFYERVFGWSTWPAGTFASQLPEAVLARGGRPHWVGHVHVEDLDAERDAWVAAGAMQLGPTRADADGARSIVLRDPQQALIVLTTRAAEEGAQPVVWHHLNTPDVAASLALYRARFGWSSPDASIATPRIRFESDVVGSLAPILDARATHAHWNLFFPTRDFDASLAVVKREGRALEPTVTPDGARVVACDDPQGAAFGLAETLC